MRSKHEIYVPCLKKMPNARSPASACYCANLSGYRLTSPRVRLDARSLLINIDREFSQALKVNEANKYYLTRNGDPFPRQWAPTAAA